MVSRRISADAGAGDDYKCAAVLHGGGGGQGVSSRRKFETRVLECSRAVNVSFARTNALY